MGTIQQSPRIAQLFGIIAIFTALILLLNVPRWVHYIFAVFWVGTGILALVVSVRK